MTNFRGKHFTWTQKTVSKVHLTFFQTNMYISPFTYIYDCNDCSFSSFYFYMREYPVKYIGKKAIESLVFAVFQRIKNIFFVGGEAEIDKNRNRVQSSALFPRIAWRRNSASYSLQTFDFVITFFFYKTQAKYVVYFIRVCTEEYSEKCLLPRFYKFTFQSIYFFKEMYIISFFVYVHRGYTAVTQEVDAHFCLARSRDRSIRAVSLTIIIQTFNYYFGSSYKFSFYNCLTSMVKNKISSE